MFITSNVISYGNVYVERNVKEDSMPENSSSAAAELRDLMKSHGVLGLEVAAAVDQNTAWVSRRLSAKVPMRIEDYALLKNAIYQVAEEKASATV